MVLQPSVTLHWNAPQLWEVTEVHAPVPLQKEAGVKLLLVHEAGEH